MCGLSHNPDQSPGSLITRIMYSVKPVETTHALPCVANRKQRSQHSTLPCRAVRVLDTVHGYLSATIGIPRFNIAPRRGWRQHLRSSLATKEDAIDIASLSTTETNRAVRQIGRIGL